jgi:hypothetical protein
MFSFGLPQLLRHGDYMVDSETQRLSSEWHAVYHILELRCTVGSKFLTRWSTDGFG